MPVYRAPVDETLFILNDVLDISSGRALPGYSDLDADSLESVLREAARLFEGVWAPTNAIGDVKGCVRGADGAVSTPAAFKLAYDAYCKGGWLGLSAPQEYGGQGLPGLLNSVVQEFAASANLALSMYPGLTQGAVAALLAHGSEEQKRLYLPPMIAGLWSGTMNLTEPHCGTDLSLIRTRAARNPDGSFALTGSKIFISAGEHDLCENVVHLVLARIEGAPAGVKGISLFVCPKFLPEADGAPGARNGVSCGAIETKMGIHGSSTCAMNYDGATAWLVGEENRGLAAMFVMMNEARLAVGAQGLAISEAAYQNALAYARERLQGRALTGPKNPQGPADPIIVHPDVRRTLMEIKAFNEAARALALEASLNADIARRSADPAARLAADDRLGLLTPVIKGVLTDCGFANAVAAQQLFGGHGYVEDWGMSQFVRDARIAMIYEGANGVQAMDLVGRKLARDGGRAVTAYFAEVGGFCEAHGANPAFAPFVAPLAAGLDDLRRATMWFMNNALARPDNAGSGAVDYMHLFGRVALAHMWARIALVAARSPDDPRMAARLVTARFFLERTPPETALRRNRIEIGADSTMALAEDAF
ncbi:MAG: acyl-CoA dehydrogenase C-terminal domain-containing protein [Microvirga sp.]|nr:acyl-CoA dehydrogenase C-terminal domain-containing protein [Microvirga sp.]